jgi:hypothetical protein
MYFPSLIRAVISYADGIAEDQLNAQGGAVCIVFGIVLKQPGQSVHKECWPWIANCQHLGR